MIKRTLFVIGAAMLTAFAAMVLIGIMCSLVVLGFWVYDFVTTKMAPLAPFLGIFVVLTGLVLISMAFDKTSPMYMKLDKKKKKTRK